MSDHREAVSGQLALARGKYKHSIYAMRISFLVVILVGLWGTVASGQPTAVTIFDLGAGVRALAMGEAFIGLADDEQASFYNPAGLAYLRKIQLSTTYERRFGASDYLSFLGALSHFGANLLYFNFGPVEERTEGDELVGTFGYLNIALAAAGGVALSEIPLPFTRGLDFLAFGSRIKFLGVSTIEGGSGSGFAIDWGLLLRAQRPRFVPIEEVRAGLLLENLIGLGVGYEGGRVEPWPLKLKLGLSVRPIPELVLALDVGVPFEFHIGGEFGLSPAPQLPKIFFRLGSFIREGSFSFTVGFGLQIEIFQIDYAFISHPQLPGSHRLAFSVRI
jgi:hypothetical protein